MRINNVNFTSNNKTFQQPKTKMTLPEKIETFREMKDVCFDVAILTSALSYFNIGDFVPENKFLRFGIVGLAVAGFTGMVLENINRHRYRKETGKVFTA